MKVIKKEDGYALFLTLLIIVLFGILSVSLLTVVVSGSKKNAVRQDITQATELSEKGLQHITNQINMELTDALGENGIPRSLFEGKLIAILNQYTCDKGGLPALDTETGKYNVCVENIADVEGADGLRKLVTFRSIGDVDGRTKEIRTQIELGAGTVPDALKYVLGTVEPVGKPQSGDGNIYLHGGLEVYGDMKVDKNLFTFDHGPGTDSRSAFWRQTTLPTLNPSSGYKKAKIALGGELYMFQENVVRSFSVVTTRPNVQRNSTKSFYDDHLNWETTSNYKKSKLEKMFANKSNLPVIVKRDWSGNQVSIEGNIKEGKNKINPRIDIAEKEFKNINTTSSVSFKNYYWYRDRKHINHNMSFKSVNRFKNGEILSGKETTFLVGSHEFDSMYINTDVVIGNSSTRDDPRYYDDISIGGYSEDRGAQLYVDGNVTIQGANLKSNLTIYTTGSVSIKHTTIQGKQIAQNQEGSLIVFSKGNIGIANNSLNKDKPSELKGYFYSESALEMYGVGSNIKIHGGIAARKITLNAIRGNYYKERSSWKDVINPTNLHSPSRLIIEYDTELIENFLKMNPPEPVIYNIDAPELINRE